MKYCNYCGCPIDEPARFCPKCGEKLPPEIADAQFPTEEAKSQTQTRPQQFTAYGVPISEPAQEPAEVQIHTNSEKRNGMGSVKALLIICFLVTVILFTYLWNHQATAERKTVRGDWKATLSTEKGLELIDIGADDSLYLNYPQMTFELNLDEDNTMVLNTTMDSDEACIGLDYSGTYEVIDNTTLRLNVKQRRYYFDGYGYGLLRDETKDLNKSLDVYYQLRGESFVLSSERGVLQTEKS